MKKNNPSVRFFLSKRSIPEDFGGLGPGLQYHYINNGQWSLHDLLAFALDYTGPASVYVSSFSLSESAIRSFLHLIDEGMINALECIFDISTKKNKFDLLFFAGNITSRIYLASNHAKLISVVGKERTVFINTSANLTVNRRYESGILITDAALNSLYHTALMELFAASVLLEF